MLPAFAARYGSERGARQDTERHAFRRVSRADLSTRHTCFVQHSLLDAVMSTWQPGQQRGESAAGALAEPPARQQLPRQLAQVLADQTIQSLAHQAMHTCQWGHRKQQGQQCVTTWNSWSEGAAGVSGALGAPRQQQPCSSAQARLNKLSAASSTVDLAEREAHCNNTGGQPQRFSTAARRQAVQRAWSTRAIASCHLTAAAQAQHDSTTQPRSPLW